MLQQCEQLDPHLAKVEAVVAVDIYATRGACSHNNRPDRAMHCNLHMWHTATLPQHVYRWVIRLADIAHCVQPA